jgi:uncharacterized membrane protein YccF (DUF307 family)
MVNALGVAGFSFLVSGFWFLVSGFWFLIADLYRKKMAKLTILVFLPIFHHSPFTIHD